MLNNSHRPLGAAIHSHPIGQPPETITVETFDKTVWKLGTKEFPQDIQNIDGHTPAYKNWWNRLRDHLASCVQPWVHLLDLVEKSRAPLTFKFLATYDTFDGATLDLLKAKRSGSKQEGMAPARHGAW